MWTYNSKIKQKSKNGVRPEERLRVYKPDQESMAKIKRINVHEKKKKKKKKKFENKLQSQPVIKLYK